METRSVSPPAGCWARAGDAAAARANGRRSTARERRDGRGTANSVMPWSLLEVRGVGRAERRPSDPGRGARVARPARRRNWNSQYTIDSQESLHVKKIGRAGGRTGGGRGGLHTVRGRRGGLSVDPAGPA